MLKHETGSSYAEQSLFPKILAQETNFALKASNTDRAFGARLAYFVYKNNIKTKVQVKLIGNVTGQAFGWLAQPGHTYIANHGNDATGGSLNGGTLYLLKSIGNQAAYGATKGEIYSPFIGDRAGVRNSGAEIVAEWIGHMGANFMTGGYFLILGEPRHYSKLKNMEKYKAPILFRNIAVGPNFGAGFTGGVVIIPRSLYKELYAKKHLAPHCENIPVQDLTSSEVKKLRVKIEKYTRHIDSLLARELLELSDDDLKVQFIKLEPSQKLISVFNETREQVENNAVDKIHALLNTTKGIEAPAFSTGLYKESEAIDACGTGVLFNLNRKSKRATTLSVLTMLTNMMHRGGVGVDAKTGDGCGVAWYGLEGFFQKQFPHLKLERNKYAIIALYVPKDTVEAAQALTFLSSLLVERGLSIKGAREVPVNLEHLGATGQAQISPLMQCVVLKPAVLGQEAFEKELIKVRLKFECTIHAKKPKEYPHIISASSYHVIYTSLVKEDNMLDFFEDFQDERFEVYAGVPHSRFATNKLPTKERIQPFANIANNGENNALETIRRALQVDPTLANLLGVESLHLEDFSDSHIMSVYIDFLQLMDYSPEKIVAATIHPCSTSQISESNFYNIFAKPFEGPNASILMLGNKIIVVRDKNGFRPQRGMINKDVLFSGSELVFSEMEGEVFDLDPGMPLVIDLEKGTYQVYEPSIEDAAFVHKQFYSFKKIPEKGLVQHIQYFNDRELEVRKLQAGWNKETLDMCLRPLFETGKEATSSMGNQVPVEALVSGAHFNISHFFLADFSQVTNPALSIEEEKFYTSTLTFAGPKPHLSELGKKIVPGYLLSSPIIDNREFLILQQDSLLNTHSISLGFDVFLGEDALKKCMQAIVAEALEAVRNGKVMIVLSDLNLGEKQASVPAVITASYVDEALIKAGMREQVCLVLQASSLFTGPQMAQAISIGGVDLVNPYLGFIPSQDFPVNAEIFERMCKNYKEGLRQAVLEFMARLGISTVSAYRGSKAFSAYGLDSEIALSLGITSDLGGVGWQDIAQILLTNHMLPKPEGLGRYSSSDTRPKIWEPSVTQAAIKASRSSTDAHSLFSIFENKANLLKTGNPRGWLRLKPPMVWSHENPMEVCILGAGAAGLYQVQALLDSKLPVKIVIIEKNAVNKFGLIGDGIAPDHPSTKKQGRIFYECLEDPRVRYFGGIEVGKQVTVEELEKHYPVVIDCRGAEEDRKLGIIGEDLPGVLYASQVYKSYNNHFNPFEEASGLGDWPFINPKNPVIAMVGQGNVASDLTRILLKDSDSLEDTSINPEFLRLKRLNPPSIIHLFGIDAPEDCKMGLKELQELEALGLPIIAYFDLEAHQKKSLTEHQKQLMAFFTKAHNNTADTQKGAIYFHFNMKPQGAREVGKAIEVQFKDDKGNSHYFTAGNWIIAIGRKPASIPRPKYKSGWVLERGGTLVFAENSVRETTQEITAAFFNGEFDNKVPPAIPQKWQLEASVTNQEQLNILRYLEDKNPLKTIDDFMKAKHHHVEKVDAPIPTQTQNVTLVASQAIKDKVLFFSKGKRLELFGSSNSLVKDIQSKSPEDAPKTECNCMGKCGSCAVSIDEMPSKPVQQSTSEKRILRGLDKAPEKHILSCAHKTEELTGGTFSI